MSIVAQKFRAGCIARGRERARTAGLGARRQSVRSDERNDIVSGFFCLIKRFDFKQRRIPIRSAEEKNLNARERTK